MNPPANSTSTDPPWMAAFSEMVRDLLTPKPVPSDVPPRFAEPMDRIDPVLRMANRVLLRCRINEASRCWEWQKAASAKKGYGRVKIDGRLLLPHRVVATAAGIIAGPREEDDPRLVLHNCDNPRCCNPDHLKAGTHSDNMKDCARRGRLRAQRRSS